MRGGAVAPNHKRGNAHQHHQGHIGSNAARVLQPLADVQPDDVQNHGDKENGKRDGEQKSPVLRQRGALPANDVGSHGSAGQQQAGKIEKGVDPVSPAGNKAVKGAEGLFGPGVEAAFLGKPRGKFVDDQRAGDEEEDRGQNPEADGRGAVVAGGGDPAGPEHGGDVEQQHIPKAHGLAQLRFGVEGGRRGSCHRVTWGVGKGSFCMEKF